MHKGGQGRDVVDQIAYTNVGLSSGVCFNPMNDLSLKIRRRASMWAMFTEYIDACFS